jgi:hypothetical protein
MGLVNVQASQQILDSGKHYIRIEGPDHFMGRDVPIGLALEGAGGKQPAERWFHCNNERPALNCVIILLSQRREAR